MHHPRRTIATVACCSLLTATPAWAGPGDDHEPEPDDPSYFDASVEPLYAIDCEEHEDVGYVQGDPFMITVVTVDGKPVEVETANAYYAMQQAAAAPAASSAPPKRECVIKPVMTEEDLKACANVRTSSNAPVVEPDRSQPVEKAASPAPPRAVQCVIKPVMTDEERRACGATQ